MTWWSWILIWLVLALCALAVLVLFVLSYWRKARALLRQLDELASRLEGVAPEASPPVESRPASSLFADRDGVRRAREDRRDARRDKIELRRSARIERGKLLVHRNRQVK
ncbi:MULTISPECIES: hypothetical protein [unclassified Rathayibacter]|uniref:hypothetical protein n=1 Tax=unclassified Rathayibacter TaxID=2609250 RepID=UPI00188B80B0|nr:MULTISPECIES: hypothetical protein [unclassified Rathayibacter]MBF4462333.1 hypothetical protein [Rathayibacter sp. VKM Ac-2879]MBF4503624.1 hypothetical protein [Rathayibacter sp. VKM Ac-2878]